MLMQDLLKTAEIVDHVLSNNIDVCIVTETWLKEADTISIAALSPRIIFLKISVDNLIELAEVLA